MSRKSSKQKISSKERIAKESARWYRIKKTYGLTREQWFAILEDQKGCCFLCLRDIKKIKKSGSKYLTVDHCHLTGKIRGLLCSNCNQNILPPFERDNSLAFRVTEYIYRQKNYGQVPNHKDKT